MEPPRSEPFGVPSQTLFHSPEAFEAYLQAVRERREKRKVRLFWERAVVQLQSEIALSEEEQDFEIAAELRSVLAEFESRLAALPQSVQTVAPLPEVATETPAPEPEPPLLKTPAEPEPPLVLKSLTELALLVETEAPSEPEPEEVIIPISAEEKEALFARLKGIEQEWEALKKRGFLHPNGERNRVRLFELRALTCDLGKLWAEACAWYIEQEFEGRVRALRENIAFERNVANDKWVCTLFDEEACWIGDDDAFSSENWTDMGQCYRDLIVAQEAWDWYSALPTPLPQTARQPLLEAISAVQRLFYDFFKSMNAHDNLQNDLKVVLLSDSNNYKAAGIGDGYLKSLHPDLSEANLKRFAVGLQSHYETAKTAWKTEKERIEKEIEKEKAMEAFQQVVQDNPEIGQDESRLEEDRATLEPLLEKVRASGIPLSNPKVRDPLLNVSPKVLEGNKHFDPLYKAISTKRKKQGLDLAPQEEEEEDAEEEISDADYDRDITWARTFVEGRKVLILGGTPRNKENVCEEIKEKLHCASMEWLESKKTDKMTKFRASIKKVDVLLVLIKFAGHDMSELGKKWIEEVGGNFMQLQRGYGVRQIVHQLALHQEQKERRVPTLNTKPNALSLK